MCERTRDLRSSQEGDKSASIGTGEIELGADEVAPTQAAMQVESVAAADDESEAAAPAPAQRKRGSLHKPKAAGGGLHRPRPSLHKASKQSRVVDSSESPPAPEATTVDRTWDLHKPQPGSPLD